MFILQRMASSYSLFTSSAFLSTPLLKTTPLHSNLTRLASSTPSELRALAVYKNRNGFSTTSLAVATDSSSHTAIETQKEKLEQTQKDKAGVFEKVVLPSNESSERLLRIRHSVLHSSIALIGFALSSFKIVFFAALLYLGLVQSWCLSLH